MPRPSSLSVEHLSTLVAVVRNGGDAAAAAREMGINQPSMSKRLSVFQKAGPHLTRPWLVRDGHTWRLTADGEAAFGSVQEVVKRYRLLFDAPELAGEPGVAVGCGQTAAGGHVRRAVAAFREEFPDVRVRVRTMRSRQRVEEVAGGRLDLAEVSHEPKTVRRVAGRAMMVWELAPEPLVVVAGTESEWGKRLVRHRKDVPLTAVDLRALGAVWLLPEVTAPVRAVIDRGLHQAGEPDVAVETGGWGVLCDYAADGVGVAVVSAAGVSGRGLVVRPLDPTVFPPIRTWVIARKLGRDRADLTPEAEAFRKMLVKPVG